MSNRSLGLLVVLVALVAAGPSPVPAEFQDLALALEERLDAFDAAVAATWDGSKAPVAFAAELLTANGNRGLQLLSPSAMAGVQLELDRVRSLGGSAVTVAIPFPLLFPSFHAWRGAPADGDALLNFYRQVGVEARSRGLKLIVESGPMFPGVYSSGAGFDVGAYYPLLTTNQFLFGRADVITTIARDVRPDWLSIGSEPDTEQQITGKPVGTPAAYKAFIDYVLGQLAAAGLGSIPIGAGAGTWDPQAAAYVQSFSSSPALAYIDLHVYPVNLNFMAATLSLTDLAQAAGKKVAMSEAWLLKARDSELSTSSNAVDPGIFARDPFRFWSRLDRKFLSVGARYAHARHLEFISAFWSKYLYAYLDHDQVKAMQPAPTSEEIMTLASSAAATAIVNNQFTETATTFALIAGTWPPGASVTAGSDGLSGTLPPNESIATVTWANGATGESGAATITGAIFAASPALAPGTNEIAVTLSDGLGNAATKTVALVGEGGGGGGGGGRCGATGLEVLLGLLGVMLLKFWRGSSGACSSPRR
jgi:hypothetical protein